MEFGFGCLPVIFSLDECGHLDDISRNLGICDFIAQVEQNRDLNNLNRGSIVVSFFETIFKIVPDFQDCPEKIQAGREFNIETVRCVY